MRTNLPGHGLPCVPAVPCVPGVVQDGLSDRVLAAALLQLQADVLQDAALQRGQRRLQVVPADVALRQPLEDRLREGGGVSSTRRQLVPVDQSSDLLPDPSRDLS